ncbi:MAG: hypothetical protein ACERKZ_17150 [Lachnotalea sp.]
MKKEKVFWGLFFILAGIFIIVSKLGYFVEVNAFSLILTIFLIACVLKSVKHLHFSGIFFPIAIICIIYANPLGISAITPGPVLGAALFASIGFSIIFHDKYHYAHFAHFNHGEKISTVIDQEDGNKIIFDTSFGSSIKYVNTDDFVQANLDCSFGSMKVYFDNAIIQNDNATINLDVSFGGVELFFPKSWNVINKTDVSFGVVEEKNRSQSTGSPNIILTGSVSFSGVTIFYV